MICEVICFAISIPLSRVACSAHASCCGHPHIRLDTMLRPLDSSLDTLCTLPKLLIHFSGAVVQLVKPLPCVEQLRMIWIMGLLLKKKKEVERPVEDVANMRATCSVLSTPIWHTSLLSSLATPNCNQLHHPRWPYSTAPTVSSTQNAAHRLNNRTTPEHKKTKRGELTPKRVIHTLGLPIQSNPIRPPHTPTDAEAEKSSLPTRKGLKHHKVETQNKLRCAG